MEKEGSGGAWPFITSGSTAGVFVGMRGRRLHFHATGWPADETLLGRLISHISETWQDKASQAAAGPSPICVPLSASRGQISLF